MLLASTVVHHHTASLSNIHFTLLVRINDWTEQNEIYVVLLKLLSRKCCVAPLKRVSCLSLSSLSCYFHKTLFLNKEVIDGEFRRCKIFLISSVTHACVKTG